MQIEHKCVGVTGLKVLDADEGLVETIVSVTGLTDNVKDIIEPGAYQKSLATRTPKGVWHHNWHESVSRTESVKELMPGDPDLPKTLPNGDPWPAQAGALKVATRFNLGTQRGREAYSDVVFFGDQQEWSIGYNVPTGGATIDSKTGVRHIKALDLYEYSPVLFGAMPVARTTSVKDAQMAYKALNSEDVEAFMTETKTLLDTLEAKAREVPLSEVEMAPGDPEELEPVDDETPEDAPNEDPDTDDTLWGDDELEPQEKSMFISAAQADVLTKAIDVMSTLLNTMTDSETEFKEGGDPETVVVESMFDLFENVDRDENVDRAIKSFEDAYDNDDLIGMAQASELILDFAEKSIEDGVDVKAMGYVSAYIQNSFEEKTGVVGTETKDAAGNATGDLDDAPTGYAALEGMSDEEKSAFLDEHTELVDGEYGEKMRRVRTKQGEDYFHVPIGNIIGLRPNRAETVMDAVLASRRQAERSNAIMGQAWRRKNSKADDVEEAIETKTINIEALLAELDI